MLEVEADVVAGHDGILLITDKGFAGRDFEQLLAGYAITLLRPSRADEQARYGEPMLKKVRQLIESVNDTLKGQLDLENHGGRSYAGVAIRVAQRILAMAAAIWRNNQTGAPVTRSLIAARCGQDGELVGRLGPVLAVHRKRGGAGGKPVPGQLDLAGVDDRVRP